MTRLHIKGYNSSTSKVAHRPYTYKQTETDKTTKHPSCNNSISIPSAHISTFQPDSTRGRHLSAIEANFITDFPSRRHRVKEARPRRAELEVNFLTCAVVCCVTSRQYVQVSEPVQQKIYINSAYTYQLIGRLLTSGIRRL